MINYGDTIELADGSQIYKVGGSHAEGWMRVNKDLTCWTLYETLEQAMDSYSLGEKSWEYRSGFECFEEEVIDHWFETGEDVESPEPTEAVYEPEQDLLQVLRAAESASAYLEGTFPRSTRDYLKDLAYHISKLQNSIQISWHVDDVMTRMADPDIGVAKEVLRTIKNGHDASSGVSWETIDNWLEHIGCKLKERV